MKALDFIQVDVFTTRKLEGNALAVFPRGAGLTTARMQAIAREMNLSETTFLLPGPAGTDARMRIFTVAEELPFAGHPTLGTAFVLAQSRRKSLIRLETKVGVIPVSVSRRAGSACLEMPQNDPVFGGRIDGRAVARAAGISAADLDARYPAQVVSTGLPFLIVPLGGPAALARLAPDFQRLRALLRRSGARFPYYLVTGAERIEARMFDRTFEDPGTGSAAGCAAAYLVRHGRCRPSAHIIIEQGKMVKRPCRIFASASLDGRRVCDVRVGGYVVETLRGRLRL